MVTRADRLDDCLPTALLGSGLLQFAGILRRLQRLEPWQPEHQVLAIPLPALGTFRDRRTQTSCREVQAFFTAQTPATVWRRHNT
jgi:hypothetical protein